MSDGNSQDNVNAGMTNDNDPILTMYTISFSQLVEEMTGVSYKDFFSKNVIESKTNENY